MLPGKIVRFVEERANVAYAGTRDRDLVPHGHRVTGWSIDAGGGTMSAFIPAPFSGHLLASLEDNGQFALTVEEFPTHETYQFKGRYIGHRLVRDDEIAIVDRVRDRFVRSVRPIMAHLTEAALRAFVAPPETVVEFEVREIYLQTPGPGAGSRLVPPAEG